MKKKSIKLSKPAYDRFFSWLDTSGHPPYLQCPRVYFNGWPFRITSIYGRSGYCICEGDVVWIKDSHGDHTWVEHLSHFFKSVDEMLTHDNEAIRQEGLRMTREKVDDSSTISEIA